MSLRNKKTGEISTNPLISVAPYTNNVRGCHIKTYRSITELNEEWEDYKPQEPLIEDEKIRKCVRLWTDINGFKDKLMYAEFDDCCSFYEEETQNELLFCDRKLPELKNRERYSITDLCREEEE